MENKRVEVGTCFMCGAKLNKPYNDICKDHTMEEVQAYYDAIEEY